MITEDYVSFETAKLLKEKGFDEKCFALYNPDSMLIQSGIKLNNTQVGQVKGSYAAPTLQMAMKWLREVHHIFISLNVVVNGIYFSLCRYKELSGDGTINYKPQPVSPTYEEAAEVAIKYCLENLI